MRPFIPARYATLAFSFLVSGMMSFFVSGIATLIAIGPSQQYFGEWMLAWFPSWLFAFPTILVVVPTVHRILKRLVVAPE